MPGSGIAFGSSAETEPVVRDRPDRVYNPLNVEEFGRNAARALMEYPADTLPPRDAFNGAGVYTIHYSGDFPAYADLGDIPIYVGKADPPRSNRGRRTEPAEITTLYGRLREHAESVVLASNLELTDFSCRWLVLDPVWIGLTEQVLITQYKPIWNDVMRGFGNHDQGGTRATQQRSRWDTLHPGRAWASRQKEREETVADITAAIMRHTGRLPI